MNLYLLIACHVLEERIERNNKILKGTSDPAVVQVLEDEIKACKYTIVYLREEKKLIRCKDCKYYTGRWCTKFSSKQFDINDTCKDDNDFCSRAERKEE